MQSKITALLSASLLLMGCADENLTPKRQEKALTQNDVARIDDADKVAYVKALNSFTLDLSKRIFPADENAVVSGFGIYTVMDMLYHGTDGKAREELVKYMHFSADPEKQATTGSAMRNLLRFDGQHKEARMTLGSRIFVDSTLNLKDNFVQVLRTRYLAPVEIDDFSDSPKTVRNINEFVRDNTMGMIPKLFDAEALRESKIALINAVAFKGKWKDEFKTGSTSPGNFKNIDGTITQKSFMNDTRSLHYYQVEGQYEAVAVPYKKYKYQMIFVRPAQSLDKIAFDGESFHTLCDALMKAPSIGVALSVPKEKVQSDFPNLVEAFRTLGIQSIFKGGLDNITDTVELYVSRILQKAVIEWNEKETKAAAASGAVADIASPGEDVVLKFDVPFAFYLVHTDTGAIIFNGQIVR